MQGSDPRPLAACPAAAGPFAARRQEGVVNIGVDVGLLAADVPDLRLVAVVTHLKSSRGDAGPADFGNARRREIVAAARHAAGRLAGDRGLTALVGGDFDVGETGLAKVGADPADDKPDGCDDTPALLTLGPVDGQRLRSLTRENGNA